jgi:hypothetical protein
MEVGGTRQASASLFPPAKSTQALSRCSLLSKCLTALLYKLNVISFTIIRIVRPNLRRFSWNSQMFNSVTWRPRTEFHPNRTATEKSAVINLFTPINKMWLLLSRFSRNSQMFNSVMWRPLTKFYPNRTVTQESVVINLFAPKNKMWLLLSLFSRNSLLQSGITRKSNIPNFIHIWVKKYRK